MVTPKQVFVAIPDGLRNPLIDEYNNIVRNYMERKWSPSELGGGRFCEIVYTILEGFVSGGYPASPVKPNNFVSACRALEAKSVKVRSFRILIPRMLLPLYEIRNNRGVGHVGGDVDPNYIDATAVLCMTSWVMAELVRVFHNLPIADAQKMVDSLVERRTPFIWQSGDMRRVLRTDLSLKDQALMLLSTSQSPVETNLLFRWTECSNRTYFNRVLRELHRARLIELSSDNSTAELLPPGRVHVDQLIARHATLI